MAVLIDTNVLVYRFDERFAAKQRIAEELVRQAMGDTSMCIAHQALIEFVAATTNARRRGFFLLDPASAHREVEELLAGATILFPDEPLLRTAMRGMATYQLEWYDAHMWAFAERYGIEQLLSEDFEHGRRYGMVQVVNPFVLLNERT